MKHHDHPAILPGKRARHLAVLLAAALLGGAVAVADDAPHFTRSQNVTINLIHRMVQRGLLSQADADELIQQAEQDAAIARAEAAATEAKIDQLAAGQSAKAPAAAMATTNGGEAPAGDDVVRVTYVPEVVKKQLREEVKQDVLAQAREERWAAPRSLPEWATRYNFFGDLRVRFEGIYFPSGNDNTGAFPSFNAINTGSPFDVTGTVFSPQRDVDQNRNRLRFRARFGADIDMGEGFAFGARIATGDSNTPVSTNQTLGGSGGDFSKYALWLDRAFITYQTADGGWRASVGRFPNPFFATEMVWDDDIGFDGLALQGRIAPGEHVKPFVTLGAFPVFNSSLNFATNQPAKFKSQDKWVFAGQLGANLAVTKDLTAKIAAAYYDFYNVEGRRSSPFTPVNASDSGDTDETRPSFAQSGNTYFPLRNIVPGPLNNYGTINQWQYFGLATPFHDIALTGRLDYDGYEPWRVSLIGEWVRNVAFDQGRVAARAVNNLGAGGAGHFVGGDSGFNLELKLGHAALEERWDWNAWLGYRHVESDAVVDAFTDSDFGSGGTNLKGFTVGGALALSHRVAVGVRWLSASSIAGPIYKNDILQLDFNGKF
ncbi:MAG TPA: putative porin [Opitutus sp.]|nr:putative porin [Opitutus sp.]